MGLGARLRRFAASLSRSFSTETEPEFVCIKCGTEHEREHHTCPDCGSDFVVPKDAEGPDY